MFKSNFSREFLIFERNDKKRLTNHHHYVILFRLSHFTLGGLGGGKNMLRVKRNTLSNNILFLNILRESYRMG